jgi:DNA polymerase (family 10)
MGNQEIAEIFHEIALYLEMQDVAFKPQAYEKAALALESLTKDIKDVYEKGGTEALKKISGVGQGIAEKIVEYLKTGKIKEYQALRKKMPVDLKELIGVEGIGPKTVRDLYKFLKIKSLKDLERAAKAGKIRDLPHFGPKTERNILEGIEFLKRSKGRFLLGEILPKVYKIIAQLKKLKEVKQISEAGSVRRRKETIGDVDILITSSNPKKVIDYFVSLPGVIKIWGKGLTKASVRLKDGLDIDLRVLPEKQFGAGLQYFTGSKEHNIVLRKIAIDKGLKLNEYGLFRKARSASWRMIAGKNEKEVYSALKMNYIEPEMRENTGEIEAAIRAWSNPLDHPLPKIINYKDVLGDLHCHSHWGAGIGPQKIDELIKMAKSMGYQYLGVSDHTKFLRIEHGIDERQLAEQRKLIDKINSRFKGQKSKFRVLQGCEANIMADGSIDIKDEALAKLDYVIAGVHSQFKMPKEKMTERIIKAMKNPNVDIISHPTGRVLQRRDEYEIDFDRILKVAKETGTILEINSNPYRLDLKDTNIRKAKKAGVKMIINTDVHQSEQMRFMEYGISQARRGWAEKKDIINCWPLKKLLKFFKK